jgi:hypothetical protein
MLTGQINMQQNDIGGAAPDLGSKRTDSKKKKGSR